MSRRAEARPNRCRSSPDATGDVRAEAVGLGREQDERAQDLHRHDDGCVTRTSRANRARYNATAASRISPIPRGRSSGTIPATLRTPTPTCATFGTHRCRDARTFDEWLQRADDRGVALAAAAAERGRTDAATAAAQLVDQREHDARARHADRVAEGDRAAVDVDDVVGDAEVAASTRCRPRRTLR